MTAQEAETAILRVGRSKIDLAEPRRSDSVRAGSMMYALCTVAITGACTRQSVDCAALQEAIRQAGRLVTAGATVAWIENDIGTIVASMAVIKKAMAHDGQKSEAPAQI